VRRIAVLVAGIGFAIALTNGGSDSSPAQAAVRHAFVRTVDAGSSRFTLSLAIPPGEAPFAVDYKIDGLMDYVRHRGQISFGSNSELLIDGDMMYIQTALPWRHDAVWVSSNTSGQESDPFDLQERAMNNPLSLLRFLTGVASDLRNAGSEQVRDAETTHYEGTLNLQNVVENAPPQERADLRDTLDFIGQFEPTSVPFGLWVDGDGVARRLRIDQKDGGSTVIEYYDFGLPVSITPPPPKATITFEELFKEVEAHQTDSNCEGDQSSSDGSSYNDQLAEAPTFVPSGSATYYVCFDYRRRLTPRRRPPTAP
jgi:hypothetical protein